MNSKFEEDSFICAGHRRPPVHIIDLALTMPFESWCLSEKNASNEVRVLPPGTFGKGKEEKGSIGAMEQLDDGALGRLEVAGPVSADIAERSRVSLRSEVNYLGLLSRRDLASAMARADVFVFPHLMRVCQSGLRSSRLRLYVIDDPNSRLP